MLDFPGKNEGFSWESGGFPFFCGVTLRSMSCGVLGPETDDDLKSRVKNWGHTPTLDLHKDTRASLRRAGPCHEGIWLVV